ncbi:restriction endonuclease subunit S [Vibrio sp. Vb0301]|uniref:restriction endonuclease subunit S n=1 Tax=Vibrio sp. Vb0301 TaxID=3074622 RepID=UPI0029654944|nr:restriction endonuclease subunit S [Vibrio sp. Vb0301]MDW2009939.1 restriction endonuclease subunit S [Vibrio sp. Vb0301]
MIMKQYVPQVRFDGFSGEWVTKSLSKIAHVIDPHPSHRAPEAVANGVPFIGIGDVAANGYVDFKNVRIVPYHIYDEHRQRYQVEVGDFAYGRVASIGKIIDLSSNVEREYTYSPTMAIVKPVALYSPYLKGYMNTSVFKGRVDNKTTGSTRKSLGVQDFRELSVCYPEQQEEQVKIGDYFQNLDVLINQHQQKHDILSNLKKAMLEKMFPKAGETIPEIRFDGFSGEWVTKSLSKIAHVIDPHPSHRAPEAVANGVPFIGIGDVAANGYVDFKNVRIVPYHIYDEHRQRYQVEVGDFAYGRVASIGKIIDLSSNVEREYTYSPTMAIVKPVALYSPYLKGYMNTSVFKGRVDNKTTGSTRKSLGVQDFRELSVCYPEQQEEQVKIGDHFRKLDLLINQHEQQITKLKNIKQACLDKMFV